MPIPNRKTWPTDRPDLLTQITDDGSRTLLRNGTQDSFHSGCGAISETRHVYLKNSGVVDRISKGQPTSVLEIGLGTSMALMLTLDLAVKHNCPLRYVALETDWIGAETLRCLQPHEWVDHRYIVDQYLQFRDAKPACVLSGSHTWQLDRLRQVQIEIGDACRWQPSKGAMFDAIYFDPFCPESAPHLWTVKQFETMRQAIADQGVLCTYSCSRPVRTALETAGWATQRVPGPKNGKREVLIAT